MKKLNASESQETENKMTSTKSAVIRGIFIRPGVSKNRRMYTRENIGKAIERMKTQLADGDGMPITMATSHGAAFNDDALATVGRLTNVIQLPDGSGQFEAEIANTAQGRDIANLAGGRFIKGVSIRGEWMGNLDSVMAGDGEEAMTAGDLRILGVDFTHSPGVEGAEIQYAALAESYSASPYNIVESIEQVEVIERDEKLVANETEDIIRAAVEDAVSSIMEKDSAKPYGDVAYADPGYQSDKQKRYPIDTAKHVRAAWSYINQPKNAEAYSTAQLKRIKSKIKSAAKKFGVEVQEEYTNLMTDVRDMLEAHSSIYANNTNVDKLATEYASSIILSMNAEEGHVLMNANGEDLATILRHDAGHDAWHAAHGDEPCTSPEDCAAKAASYKEESDANMECHECGTECHEDAAFCHACGSSMASKIQHPACANCGAESVPDSAMYCPTCGHPVPQAESTDDALTQTKENVEVDENITTAEASAEESGQMPVEARTLTDADTLAIAMTLKSLLAPQENAPEAEVEAEVETPSEEEAVEAPAEEEVPAEVPAEDAEAQDPQENTVENTFTAEQVASMIAEAASKAATEAVAAARKDAVESYRSNGAGRKGLVAGMTGSDASDLSDGEITSESLAEMSSSDFRKVQSEVWGNTNFFSAKFAQADRGF